MLLVRLAAQRTASMAWFCYQLRVRVEDVRILGLASVHGFPEPNSSSVPRGRRHDAGQVGQAFPRNTTNVPASHRKLRVLLMHVKCANLMSACTTIPSS